MTLDPQDIIDFWYSPDIKAAWFKSTPGLDGQIRQRFESVWQSASEYELDAWMASPEGCLALVIILDQLPLNMFRGEAKSFSTEDQAVEVCLHAIEQGYDQQLNRDQQAFLYMPLMHSERMDHQDKSVALFAEAGLKDNLRFAEHHRAIIARFGRFPHRNAILNRSCTPEELEYLASKEAFTG